MNSCKEEFKEITYSNIKKDLYSISNYGRIYNIHRKIIMKTYFDKDGYEKITLVTNTRATNPNKRGNKSRHVFVHRLVAWEFLHKPDEYHNVVNHKDGKVGNNFYKNLEWCSVKENTYHAKRMKLLNNSGINCKCCKYKEKDIRLICQLLENGLTNSEIYNLLSSKLTNKTKYALYSLINKISRKMCYWDIVSEYHFKVPLQYFKCDNETHKIRKMIISGKDNIVIMRKFGYNTISENKKFYNKIISERQKCKVMFNDYRKYIDMRVE